MLDEVNLDGKIFPRENNANQSESSINRNGLDLIHSIPMDVMVELGRTRMSVQSLLELGHGGIIELDKAADGLLVVSVNGMPVAEGEVVVINHKYGIKLSRILSIEERIGHGELLAL